MRRGQDLGLLRLEKTRLSKYLIVALMYLIGSYRDDSLVRDVRIKDKMQWTQVAASEALEVVKPEDTLTQWPWDLCPLRQ